MSNNIYKVFDKEQMYMKREPVSELDYRIKWATKGIDQYLDQKLTLESLFGIDGKTNLIYIGKSFQTMVELAFIFWYHFKNNDIEKFEDLRKLSQIVTFGRSIRVNAVKLEELKQFVNEHSNELGEFNHVFEKWLKFKKSLGLLCPSVERTFKTTQELLKNIKKTSDVYTFVELVSKHKLILSVGKRKLKLEPGKKIKDYKEKDTDVLVLSSSIRYSNMLDSIFTHGFFDETLGVSCFKKLKDIEKMADEIISKFKEKKKESEKRLKSNLIEVVKDTVGKINEFEKSIDKEEQEEKKSTNQVEKEEKEREEEKRREKRRREKEKRREEIRRVEINWAKDSIKDLVKYVREISKEKNPNYEGAQRMIDNFKHSLRDSIRMYGDEDGFFRTTLDQVNKLEHNIENLKTLAEKKVRIGVFKTVAIVSAVISVVSHLVLYGIAKRTGYTGSVFNPFGIMKHISEVISKTKKIVSLVFLLFLLCLYVSGFIVSGVFLVFFICNNISVKNIEKSISI